MGKVKHRDIDMHLHNILPQFLKPDLLTDRAIAFIAPLDDTDPSLVHTLTSASSGTLLSTSNLIADVAT